MMNSWKSNITKAVVSVLALMGGLLTVVHAQHNPGDTDPKSRSVNDSLTQESLLEIADFIPGEISLEAEEDPEATFELAIQAAAKKRNESVAAIQQRLQRFAVAPPGGEPASGARQAMLAFCRHRFSDAVRIDWGKPSSLQNGLAGAGKSQEAKMACLLFRGHCHLLSRNYADAASCYQQCLPLAESGRQLPESAKIKYFLGIAQWKNGQQKEAIAQWRSTASSHFASESEQGLSPTDTNGLLILVLAGEFETVRPVLQTLVDAPPGATASFSRRTLPPRQWLARILILQGDFRNAEIVSRQSWEIARTSLGVEDPDTLQCEADLALCLCELGSFTEADERAGHAVAGAEKCAPGGRLFFQALEVIAEVHAAERKLAAAKKEMAAAAAGLRRTAGPAHIEALRADLAGLNLESQLDCDHASLEPFRALFDDELKLYGTNHPLSIRTALALARATQRCGALKEAAGLLVDLDDRAARAVPNASSLAFEIEQCRAELAGLRHENAPAEELGQRAYDGLKKTLGEAAPRTLACGYLLSRLRLANKHPDAALDLATKNNATATALLRKDHPLAVWSGIELMRTSLQAGKFDKIVQLASELSEAMSKTTEAEPFNRAALLLLLGDAIESTGRLADAQEYYDEVAAEPGDDSPQKAVAAYRVGRILARNGALAKARAKLEETLAVDDRFFGPLHTRTMDTAELLATVLAAGKEMDQAVKFLRARESSLADVPGSGVARANLVETLADLYKTAGKMDEYFAEEKREMELIRMEEGEDSREAQGFGNNLGIELLQAGRLDETLELWQAVLDSRERAFGPDDFETMSSLNNLGSVYAEKGDWKRAVEIHRLCLERRTSKLGRGHPDTIKSLMNLANNLQPLGEKAEALKDAQEAVELARKCNPRDDKLVAAAQDILDKVRGKTPGTKARPGNGRPPRSGNGKRDLPASR